MMRSLVSGFVLSSVALSLACGEPAPDVGSIELLHENELSSRHLSTCDDPACGEGKNLPLGGSHCGETISCRVHPEPQSRCRWIHNLEHGHAALIYNCPEGCDELVQALVSLEASLDAAGNPRVMVLPDNRISTRFAAVVWGWGWAGEELDREAIDAVLAKQDQDAPEPGLGCAP